MISSCLRNYNIIYEKELLFPSYKFCHDKKRGLEYGNSKYDPEIGNYEYNVDILNEKHPKFSIGKQTKGYSKGYKTQGPGQYEYKNYIGKEDQKIIMIAKSNSRLKEVNRRYVYGPQQYDEINEKIKISKNPLYKIGTAKRRSLYNSVDYPVQG